MPDERLDSRTPRMELLIESGRMTAASLIALSPTFGAMWLVGQVFVHYWPAVKPPANSWALPYALGIVVGLFGMLAGDKIVKRTRVGEWLVRADNYFETLSYPRKTVGSAKEGPDGEK